ncbi:MAG: DUF2256 domain-containing protein [Pelobium sp.]
MQNKSGQIIAKANLPTKNCLACKKPFSWRKKWRNCWNDVKYCSERCRNIKL